MCLSCPAARWRHLSTLLWAGRKQGFHLALSLLLTSSPEEAPPPPVQAGPRGLLCPAGWSLPVPPAFAQEVSSHPWQVFLPRAPAAHGLACGQPQNKCSWGGSTPVMPPPDFSWPLTFGWLGQTLFSLPGCCMRSSDTLSSMPNLLVTPGLHVCPVPSGSGTALCREQADAGQLAPVGAGAGCHAAPWGSSEATLVAPRRGSHIQRAGLGRRQRGPRWRTARRSNKAACKGLRSEAEQDHVWGRGARGRKNEPAGSRAESLS